MPTEVVCPDCNKVIAPAGEVEDAVRCHCGDDFSRPSTKPFEPSEEQPRAARPAKACYVCGVDLTNQIRLKDHLGRYWCEECTEAERRAKKRESELTCSDCHRMVGATKLYDYDDVRLCRTCLNMRKKAAEAKLTKLGVETAHKRTEINRIKWLAIIAGVLIVLATLNMFVFR